MPDDRNLLPNKSRFSRRLTGWNRPAKSLFAHIVLASTTVITFTGVVLAEPQGGIVTSGSTATNINQTTDHLQVDWQKFSTTVNESVNFYQPGASAIVVDRVIGKQPARPPEPYLFRSRVFIINPPKTATKANPGQVKRGSEGTYTLDPRGDGRITFEVDADTAADIAGDGKKLGIIDTGSPEALSGQIALTPVTTSRMRGSVINLNGVVDANTFVSSKSGVAVLVASPVK